LFEIDGDERTFRLKINGHFGGGWGRGVCEGGLISGVEKLDREVEGGVSRREGGEA